MGRADAADRYGLVGGRPELVVEVISPRYRRHDRVRKLDWYASIGVPEYWLVDPEERTIERLVLTGSHYTIAQTATDGFFRPASFEGLEIPLELLWAS
jgi:Uma2 family endonuclease